MKFIGKRTRGIDWKERTSGSLKYTADFEHVSLLHAAVLRSPHPHARIVSISLDRARALPGVKAVINAADLPAGACYFHEGKKDRPPFADGVVRFVGQEVAAVAAETRQQAQAALRAIEVVYELLAAPLSTAQALSDNSVVLHDRPSGQANVSHTFRRLWGDAEGGKRASTKTVQGKFTFPRQSHASMETHICTASWNAETGKLHYWASTQAPYYIVTEVSQVLGLGEGQVVCHEVGVGGGFGAKSKICEHEVVAGALSMAAGRPVMLQFTREEEFETTKSRHRFDLDMRLHADEGGRLRAIEADVVVENGAYDHSGVSVMSAGTKGLGMLYRPDGVDVTARLVDTAILPGGQFRGYGTTQTSFALECLMDDLAVELKTDPIALRLTNANGPGETTAVGAHLGSARLRECLTAVRTALDWDAEKGNRRPGRGLGVSSGVHVSGAYTTPGSNRSDCAIDLFTDGRVRVRFGGSDPGTGQRTILAQIAGEELGVDPANIEVITMDTSCTPFDMGAWSSRGTHYGGHAVRKAALAAAERLKGFAREWLGTDGLTFVDGHLTNGSETMSIAALVTVGGEARDGVMVTETSFVEISVVPSDRATGMGNVSPSYNFACHGAVVEVDPRTGEVDLIDFVAAHDVGVAINPGQVEGQIIGGAVMGIGAALGEEMIFEQGKLVNPAYLHYALPRAADVPNIRAIMIEGGDPRGPYGAKAIGECGINPPAAAISNAIFDACGVRVSDLPITPDKILNALALKEGRRRRHRLWMRPSRWWITVVRKAYPLGLLKLLHSLTAKLPSHEIPPPLQSISTPARLSGALAELSAGARPLGGGTDLHLQRRQGIAAPTTLVAVNAVLEMQGVRDRSDGSIEIGAAVTLADLSHALRKRVPIIAHTIDTIASAQIREMATVGGNLSQAKRCWFFRNGFGCYKRLGGLAPCYAITGDHRFYHVAIDGHRCQATTPSDLATTFTSMNAHAVIASPSGERLVDVANLYSGPGETVLRRDELVRSIVLPPDAGERVGAFQKLRLWEGDFAVASVAISAARDSASGILSHPSIVFGGLAPTPWRAARTQRDLDGLPLNAPNLRTALDREFDRAGHPLARNAWKLDAAAGLAERALETLSVQPG